MRNPLAERLLAQVMKWSENDVAQERPILQSMADYKYDEYQQFIPGMRFVESLALWLSQFKNQKEKDIAYKFVKDKLVFFSTSEINHLVEMAYPDFIKQKLLKKVADQFKFNYWEVNKIVQGEQFRIAQRKTLFLGLSDGARTDVFRRFNNEQLSHEQIYPTYEINSKRADSLLEELKVYIKTNFKADDVEESRFQTVVLLDDFSASGLSYIREDDGELKGKIVKLYESLTDSGGELSKLIDTEKTDFYVVLYIATDQAIQHLESLIKKLGKNSNSKFSLIVVHQLNSNIKINHNDNSSFNDLINEYYDENVENKHTEIGGNSVKFGFASCGLPIVLNHNTPNNSIALLWADTEKVKALFPRVNRHS